MSVASQRLYEASEGCLVNCRVFSERAHACGRGTAWPANSCCMTSALKDRILRRNYEAFQQEHLEALRLNSDGSSAGAAIGQFD